jgi:hypothetical protein
MTDAPSFEARLIDPQVQNLGSALPHRHSGLALDFAFDGRPPT